MYVYRPSFQSSKNISFHWILSCQKIKIVIYHSLDKKSQLSLHKQFEKSWLLSKPSILKVRNVNQEEKEIILSHHYQEKDFDGRLPNEAKKRNPRFMKQNLNSY